MLREYSRTKAESFAKIRASVNELQHFFKDCILLAHPVYILRNASMSNKGKSSNFGRVAAQF